MVCPAYEVLGQVFDELFFGFKGCAGLLGKAQTRRNPENMRIDRHGWLVENNRSNHISSFAAYAGQLHQLIDFGRYDVVEFVVQHLSEPHQMFGLVVRVRNAADERKNLLHACPRKTFGGGKSLKKTRRGKVYTFVGALGTEYHGHQQFIRIAVKQFRFGIWCCLQKMADDEVEAFFAAHARKIRRKGGISALLQW